MSNSKIWILASAVILGGALLGCGSGSSNTESTAEPGTKPATGGGNLSGSISIDGSSTVYPISEAIAEEFQNGNSGVKVTVAKSGTGGGFKKFANGEIDVAGASRPIEEKEIEACKAKGIDFIEIPIAFDGLSVVVNPQNDFATDLTVAELKKIWEPNSKVKTWADVRAGFPAEPIKLYGPGTDSGTFDYFTKAINGKEKESRADYQSSEDDNVLVTGVAGDKYSLGYFGYAYFVENKDKIKLVKVAGIEPNDTTIADGTYTPLSRPLFWYVNVKALDRPEVVALVNFLLEQGGEFIKSTNYIPLPADAYALAKKRVEEKKTGTVFKGAQAGMKIQDVLQAEGK